MTVFDLEKMVAMELGVPPKYCTLFGIFYEKCGYTQKPKPDAKLLEIFRRFNKDAREYGESKTKKLFPVLSGSRFVYKKWNFSRPGEIGIQSKATLALLFMQVSSGGSDIGRRQGERGTGVGGVFGEDKKGRGSGRITREHSIATRTSGLQALARAYHRPTNTHAHTHAHATPLDDTGVP